MNSSWGVGKVSRRGENIRYFVNRVCREGVDYTRSQLVAAVVESFDVGEKTAVSYVQEMERRRFLVMGRDSRFLRRRGSGEVADRIKIRSLCVGEVLGVDELDGVRRVVFRDVRERKYALDELSLGLLVGEIEKGGGEVK